MAPLPTTNTHRLVVDYNWRNRLYKTLYRFPAAVSKASAIGAVEAFHVDVRPTFLNNWNVVGTARWYPVGSNVSSDEAIANPGAGTGGPDPGDAIPDSQQWEFVGRSADGRRVSWYYQGVAIVQKKVLRTLESESATVATFLDALDALVLVGLATVSGAAPVLKRYSNTVMNDYLTRQSRRG